MATDPENTVRSTGFPYESASDFIADPAWGMENPPKWVLGAVSGEPGWFDRFSDGDPDPEKNQAKAAVISRYYGSASVFAHPDDSAEKAFPYILRAILRVGAASKALDATRKGLRFHLWDWFTNSARGTMESSLPPGRASDAVQGFLSWSVSSEAEEVAREAGLGSVRSDVLMDGLANLAAYRAELLPADETIALASPLKRPPQKQDGGGMLWRWLGADSTPSWVEHRGSVSSAALFKAVDSATEPLNMRTLSSADATALMLSPAALLSMPVRSRSPYVSVGTSAQDKADRVARNGMMDVLFSRAVLPLPEEMAEDSGRLRDDPRGLRLSRAGAWALDAGCLGALDSCGDIFGTRLMRDKVSNALSVPQVLRKSRSRADIAAAKWYRQARTGSGWGQDAPKTQEDADQMANSWRRLLGAVYGQEAGNMLMNQWVLRLGDRDGESRGFAYDWYLRNFDTVGVWAHRAFKGPGDLPDEISGAGSPAWESLFPPCNMHYHFGHLSHGHELPASSPERIVNHMLLGEHAFTEDGVLSAVRLLAKSATCGIEHLLPLWKRGVARPEDRVPRVTDSDPPGVYSEAAVWDRSETLSLLLSRLPESICSQAMALPEVVALRATIDKVPDGHLSPSEQSILSRMVTSPSARPGSSRRLVAKGG